MFQSAILLERNQFDFVGIREERQKQDRHFIQMRNESFRKHFFPFHFYSSPHLVSSFTKYDLRLTHLMSIIMFLGWCAVTQVRFEILPKWARENNVATFKDPLHNYASMGNPHFLISLQLRCECINLSPFFCALSPQSDAFHEKRNDSKWELNHESNSRFCSVNQIDPETLYSSAHDRFIPMFWDWQKRVIVPTHVVNLSRDNFFPSQMRMTTIFSKRWIELELLQKMSELRARQLFAISAFGRKISGIFQWRFDSSRRMVLRHHIKRRTVSVPSVENAIVEEFSFLIE